MVVLDSSAIILLLKIGRIALVKKVFKTIIVPQVVWQEVVEDGKKLGKPTYDFESEKGHWFQVVECKNKNEANQLALSERIQHADAEVLLIARERNDILLTNDAGLHSCCKSKNVEVWWLTTLIFAAAKKKLLTKEEAEKIVLDLVTIAKMRLSGEVLSEILIIIRNI